MQTLPTIKKCFARKPKCSFSAPNKKFYSQAISSLLNKPFLEVQQALQQKQITSEELTNYCLQKAKDLNPELNAYVHFSEGEALAQAQESDQRRKNGEAPKSLIDGIPFSLKDIYCTKGIPTTVCSNMLKNYTPPYNATITAKLLEAGGVLLGKNNMDEFAMGSSTTFSSFGPTVNPWKKQGSDEKLIAGGSSGGSASAVASRSSYFSIGSDTGGSVRLPASYCGIVGFKPSYGVISRYGMIAYASSLDTVAYFSKSVAEAAAVLDILYGGDARDSSSRPVQLSEANHFYNSIKQACESKNVSLKGKKIGIPAEYFVKELNEEIVSIWNQTIQYCKDAGAEVYYVSLPYTPEALFAYYVIAPAEASSNLARYDGVRYGNRAMTADSEKISMHDLYTLNRTEGFGDEVKRRIISGTFALSVDKYDAFFKKAQQVRKLVTEDFTQVFNEGIDILLTPTAPTPAIPLEECQKQSNPVEAYVNDVFTIPASLAGLPSISIPVSLSKQSGLPLGLQLIGPALGEAKVLETAQILENIVSTANKESFISKLPQIHA